MLWNVILHLIFNHLLYCFIYRTAKMDLDDQIALEEADND